MRYRLNKLAQYLRGWMGYFGISEYYRPIPKSTSGCGEGCACATGNSGACARTKVRHLLALGSSRSAISTAISQRATGTCRARWPRRPG